MEKIEDQKKQIKLEDLIKARIQGEKYINVQDGNDEKEGVILIGKTGVGKSTIAALFYGVNYRSHDPNNVSQLQLDPAPYPHSKRQLPDNFLIEHMCQSGTEIPNIIKDLDHNIYFMDMPGYDDSKGITQEIINGYYIYRSFQIHKKVKVLFVTTQSAMSDVKCTLFLQSVKSISQSFQNTNYKHCLGIIVTLADPEYTSQMVVQNIKQNILKASQLDLNDKAKEFLQYIVDNPNYITIMKKPKEAKDNLEEFFLTFKQNTYKLINKLQSMVNPEISTPVSEEAQVALIPFIEQIKEQARLNINNSIGDIQKYFTNYFKAPKIRFNDQYNKEANQSQFQQLQTSKNLLIDLEKSLQAETLPKLNVQVITVVMDKCSEQNIQNENLGQLKNQIITMEYLKTLVSNLNVNEFVQDFIQKLTQTGKHANSQYEQMEKQTLDMINQCAKTQLDLLCIEFKESQYYQTWSKEASNFFIFISSMQQQQSFENLYEQMKQQRYQDKFHINIVCIDQFFELLEQSKTYLGKDKVGNVLQELKNKLKDSQIHELRIQMNQLRDANQNQNTDHIIIQSLQQENQQLRQQLIQQENASKQQQLTEAIKIEKQQLIKDLQQQMKNLNIEKNKTACQCQIF